MYDYCEQHGVAHERCGKVIVARRRRRDPRAGGARAARPRERCARPAPPRRRRAFASWSRTAAGRPACTRPPPGSWTSPRWAGRSRPSCASRASRWPRARRSPASRRPRDVVVLRHPGVRHAPGWPSSAVAATAIAWRGWPAVRPTRASFRSAASYLRLLPGKRSLVRSLIYPVPDPSLPFLGVHLSRHVDGEVSLGPTALLWPAGRLGSTLAWPGTWRMARRWWRTALSEARHAVDRRALARAASAYVPGIEAADLRPCVRRRARPGAGPRRPAGGRLRRARDRAGAPRSQRALARRHLGVRARPAAGRSGRAGTGLGSPLMKRLETRLEGPILVEPVVHGDERGFFHESYRRNVYAELGIPEEFVQDNHSRSRHGHRARHALPGRRRDGQARALRAAARSSTWWSTCAAARRPSASGRRSS